MPNGYLPGPSGFKCALHRIGRKTDPDKIEREVGEDDREEFLPLVQKYLPRAYGNVLDTKVCLYANSEDGHFRIGLHPKSDRVVVAAGFSGHGFKFQPVMGEILADLAL